MIEAEKSRATLLRELDAMRDGKSSMVKDLIQSRDESAEEAAILSRKWLYRVCMWGLMGLMGFIGFHLIKVLYKLTSICIRMLHTHIPPHIHTSKALTPPSIELNPSNVYFYIHLLFTFNLPLFQVRSEV